MKRVISLILALIMGLSLVACGEKPTDDPNAGEGTYKERIVIANSGVLNNLDIQNNNDLYNQHVYGLTHNSLVNFDTETKTAVPELATSWEKNGLEITFHLREGVKFHNGEAFTADDVIYTYTRGMDFSFQQTKLKYIEKMEAPDPYTLVITLNQPNAEFVENLSSNNLGILCQKAVEADPDKGCMVGTGAFMLTEWNPDEDVLVTRFDEYWDDLPKTKEIQYRKIGEASARVISLQTGEIDICLDVPAIEAPTVSDAAGCDLVQIPGTKMVYLALNHSDGGHPAVKDKRVRQALNYATNTSDIIIAMTEGYASPANGLIPSSMFGYDPDVKTYGYDLEKAKSLLAEAGYGPSNPLEIKMVYKGSQFPGLYEVLQAQWALAGVNLILESDDSTTTSDIVRTKKYDMYQSNWNWSTTCLSLSSLWHSTSGNNRTLTYDAQLDQMLDAATNEMDEAVREKLINEISAYLSEHAAMIPLYIDTLLTGVRENVENPGLVYTQRHDFTYVCAKE